MICPFCNIEMTPLAARVFQCPQCKKLIKKPVSEEVRIQLNKVREELVNITERLMFLEHNYPSKVFCNGENKETLYIKRDQVRDNYQAILDHEGLDDYEEDEEVFSF
ncbi:MAG: hypothetical protein EU529_02605 [Promethearchaeota archaeon]|nr:MAG: hypothetical protein EU529_02605 [Candidatus Lokiarchaeota archaeon]